MKERGRLINLLERELKREEMGLRFKKRGENTNLTLPFLDNSPPKTIHHRGACASVFIVALFTVAKSYNRPSCPSTEE